VHAGGYALQTALHAPGVEQAIAEVTRGNGVSDEQASVFKLVIYIERFGTNPANYWRRITDLYEVHEVRGGRPMGQSLFQWRADRDRFEKLSEPSQFGLDRAGLAHRASVIEDLAQTGKSSPDEVESAVTTYRNGILTGRNLANS
jgi:hypothetical protein